MKSGDTTSSTPSAASEAGPLPAFTVDFGPPTESGLGVVPASPTPSPENKKATPIPETSGPHSSGSSASAALSELLASRCRTLLGTAGSMEYRQTWKKKATPSGRSYWAHTASEHRTSGKDCSGWPTPNTPSGGRSMSPEKMDATGRTLDGKKHTASLEHAVKFVSGWTTPTAHDSTARSSTQKELHGTKHGCACLALDAAKAGWPTPMAGTPAQNGYNEAGNTDSSRKTVALVSGWATPTSRDHKDSSSVGTAPINGLLGWQAWTTGPAPSGTPAPTESSGASQPTKKASLNPHFSLWLQGYPVEWGYSGVRAMLSCQKSRRSSSRPAVMDVDFGPPLPAPTAAFDVDFSDPILDKSPTP